MEAEGFVVEGGVEGGVFAVAGEGPPDLDVGVGEDGFGREGEGAEDGLVGGVDVEEGLGELVHRVTWGILAGGGNWSTNGHEYTRRKRGFTAETQRTRRREWNRR